jgi:predicted PhzF superfamily epimerase YddE/YHI9
MRHPILIVDAFADRPFAGNPAAVMLLDAPLPERAMQAIAAEMAQAETAFAVARPDGGWDLRWFTPLCEVPFCGHATLAAAHALAETGRASGTLAFHTREMGVLRVGQEGKGLYALDLPRLDPGPGDLDALRPLVPGGLSAFRSFENHFVELGSEAEIRAFEPDLAAIARLGAFGLCVTAPGVEADFASRYFAPGAGIPEDAVTGSIHATLVPFWAARLGRDRLEAVQASRRGGRLGCRLAGDRVILTGRAVTVLRGEIAMPGDDRPT